MPTANNFEQLSRTVCSAVRETAAFIRNETGKVAAEQVEEKFLNGLVSYVDRTAEEMLVERLQRIVPEATFVTEEGTVENRASGLQWVIDPLDGTTNFLYGLPHFSISVALVQEGRAVIGAVHHVPLDELYYAWQGGGAYCNDRRIRVSQRSEMRQALVSTGFPYHNFSRAESWFKALNTFLHEGRGLRRYGSAALDLAYVACGRYDVFFEYGLNAWDVAGGALLVQEAGGVMSDFSGGDSYLNGAEVLACNPVIYPEVLRIIGEAFNVGKV